MRWPWLFVALLAPACRTSPQPAAAVDAAAPVALDGGTHAGPLREGKAYDLRDAEAGTRRTIVPPLTKDPWIRLAAVTPPPAASFYVEDDGTAVFQDGARVWVGRIELQAVRDVEEVLRRHRICELANTEATHERQEFTVLSLHGFECEVALSHQTWLTNPRARAAYQAVRGLMKSTCADACMSQDLPELRDRSSGEGDATPMRTGRP
ncbi:hypothetical protein LVJ94_34795 [Pendulispora rubella]|uniref:Lipoprotein n=1 Tax=Pendulispora rubella TaxID=2741070 RepID=A0ABZ2KXM9_9BACT